MFARYKKTILKLTEMLRALEANTEDRALLIELQRELVMAIRRTDKRIAKLKSEQRDLIRKKKAGRVSKEESNKLKRKIDALADAISNAQKLNIVWRYFGDGIAFIYLDKHALKHMLYNMTDYQVRQSPGAISDKSGFKNEWAMLKLFNTRGIPAMLCDASNTLRHGDICLLGGEDPFPIEVKSSRNANARVGRQIASLTELHKFFDTDEAENFRGTGHVNRVELTVLPPTYIREINECIGASRGAGYAFVFPEKGITYSCFRSDFDFEPKGDEAFISPQGNRVMYKCLNEEKSAGQWMPYYPFTLSIRDATSLFEFINGDYVLMVAIDIDEIVRRFDEKGLEARFIADSEWAIEVRSKGAPDDASSALSGFVFGRLYFEFESIAYLTENSVDFDKRIQEMLSKYAETTAGDNPKIPKLLLNGRPKFKYIE